MILGHERCTDDVWFDQNLQFSLIVGLPASKMDKDSQIDYVLRTGKPKVTPVKTSTDNQILRFITLLSQGQTIREAIERIISFAADEIDFTGMKHANS